MSNDASSSKRERKNKNVRVYKINEGATLPYVLRFGAYVPRVYTKVFIARIKKRIYVFPKSFEDAVKTRYRSICSYVQGESETKLGIGMEELKPLSIT